MNLYLYAGANPIGLTDPEGKLLPAVIFFGPPLIVMGVVISPVVAVVAAVVVVAGVGYAGYKIWENSGAKPEPLPAKEPEPVSSPSGKSDDKNRDPAPADRDFTMCRCKSYSNSDNLCCPQPQQYRYAERMGSNRKTASQAACRAAGKFIGKDFPGCQGEHCHCVCRDGKGPPYPYNPS